MFVEVLLILLGVGLLLLTGWGHRYLTGALRSRRRHRGLREYPSVTVIRPIRGLDTEAEQNIDAALNTDYPGDVEIFFVFDDATEPAIPLVQTAIDTHRGVNARILFCGQPPAGRTGKLNAMIFGLQKARGELIAFADSDIRPDRSALTTLVSSLMGTHDAGAAFMPVVATQETRTVGDAGYALLMNGLYGPAAAAATQRNGGDLPFIMGQLMVFKREAIDAIGGLEAADGQLVDDMHLGACLSAAGYRNVVAPDSVPIIQHGLSLIGFAAVYRRWITFSRSGLPGWSFKAIPMMYGVVFWLGLIATIVALCGGFWLAAAVAGLAPVMVSWSINGLHRHLGGDRLPPRHWWVSFGLMLVAPLIYLSIFGVREVGWRGRKYKLNAKSRLASSINGRAPASVPPFYSLPGEEDLPAA